MASLLEAYLNRLCLAGKAAMAESVGKTARRFCGQFLDAFDFCSQASALLVGNVQSGKTGQMFGIISAAADNDFFIFVILTTDNVLLQSQTLERARRDLLDFCICGEDDAALFVDNDGIRPAVVVLKKNVRTLRRWKKLFLTSRTLKGNPIFILDDEADAASLNARVNQNDVSAINRHIAEIRRNAASSIYLEVTGTPQSIFLQTALSGFRPQYVLAFEPGAGYLGGDFFFSSRNPVSRSIGFTDDDPAPVETFVARHLVVSAIALARGDAASNALAHVSARTDEHDETASEIRAVLQRLSRPGETMLESRAAAVLRELEEASLERRSLDEIVAAVRQTVLPSVRVVVKNSRSDDEAQLDAGCTFIVGGNSLGRGVTIPRLNTVLYTRLSKRPQADTIWQHNRIFGYDRDPRLIRVFLTRHLWKLLSAVNDQNNSMYAQIRAGISDVRISLPAGLEASRREVLDRRGLTMLLGGVNRYPDDLANDTVGKIDALVSDVSDSGFVRRPLSFVRRLLACVVSRDEDFSVEGYDEIFEALLAENPDAQAVLIVRRGRSVAQGTGALLSPNDWRLGENFPGETVLTLYRVDGEKGWGGKPLWVPNVRLPEKRVFFVMKRQGVDGSGLLR